MLMPFHFNRWHKLQLLVCAAFAIELFSNANMRASTNKHYCEAKGGESISFWSKITKSTSASTSPNRPPASENNAVKYMHTMLMLWYIWKCYFLVVGVGVCVSDYKQIDAFNGKHCLNALKHEYVKRKEKRINVLMLFFCMRLVRFSFSLLHVCSFVTFILYEARTKMQ